MTRLRDALDSARSKNAGPFQLTIDLFFKDRHTFAQVVENDIITSDVVARLYRVDPASVKVFCFGPAAAIKVSFPRDVPAGSPGDRDVYGGQQFGPMLDLELDRVPPDVRSTGRAPVPCSQPLQRPPA